MNEMKPYRYDMKWLNEYTMNPQNFRVSFQRYYININKKKNCFADFT